MRRVSSRQRLVSWDAFDATALWDSDSDDFRTCYEGALSRQSSLAQEDASHEVSNTLDGILRRKRERPSRGGMEKTVSFTNLLHDSPVVINAHSWELEQHPLSLLKNLIQIPTLRSDNDSGQIQLDQLMQDVQLHILSFLCVSDARAWSATSHLYRRLLLSDEARSIWIEWYHIQWPFIVTDNVTFVDATRLPTAVGTFKDQVNLSVLLSMAAAHQPVKIDESLLVPPQYNRLRRWRPTPKRVAFRTYQTPDGRSVVQYTGTVGTGDRCIRSDQPLPRPKRLEGSLRSLTNKSSFLDFLCRGARAVGGGVPSWSPFVAPFMTRGYKVHLTPRLVSYFEVSILSHTASEPRSETLPTAPSECVAIGVATNHFDLYARMPGWDMLSYGYHGDDGGVFHGSGDMLRRFGPSYGQGDTVGCGVDYLVGGIFFTLNGNFLGYGWTGVDTDVLQQDLYPTIGVDTDCPIYCNYGERPFMFDLATILQRQGELVKECCLAPRRATAKSAL